MIPLTRFGPGIGEVSLFSPDERPLSKMMFEIQSDAGPLTMNDFCIKF